MVDNESDSSIKSLTKSTIMESNAFTQPSNFFIAVFRYGQTDYKIRVRHSKLTDQDYFEIECSDGNIYHFERVSGAEPKCLNAQTNTDKGFLSEMASVLMV